ARVQDPAHALVDADADAEDPLVGVRHRVAVEPVLADAALERPRLAQLDGEGVFAGRGEDTLRLGEGAGSFAEGAGAGQLEGAAAAGGGVAVLADPVCHLPGPCAPGGVGW